MKEEYIDTAFGKLIESYSIHDDRFTDEEIEKALREHARLWGGCISCRYSICKKDPEREHGNIWHARDCQVGLKQDGCRMYQEFPE